MLDETVKTRAQFDGQGVVQKTGQGLVSKAADDGHSFVFRITDGTKDRDGDIIDPDGWDFSEFDQNPIGFFGHETWGMPVCKWGKPYREGDAWYAVASFPPDAENTDRSIEVRKLLKAGILRACSVGFHATQAIRIEHEDGSRGYKFIAQTLWEISIVGIPANANALTEAKQKGLGVKALIEYADHALDAGGDPEDEKVLGQIYVKENGRVHPAQQDRLRAKNLEKKSQTSTEEGHSHEVEDGATVTGPAGDPEHVHAVTYEEEGGAKIEDAEGHTHELSSEEESEEKELSNFPEVGLDLPVSKAGSAYPWFPTAEATHIKNRFPDIWALSPDVETFRGAGVCEDFLRHREKWAAENLRSDDLAGLISQIKHHVIDERGLDYMRAVLSEAKTAALIRDEAEARAIDKSEIDAMVAKAAEAATADA